TASSSTLQRREAVANAGASEGSSPAGSSVENVSGSHETASSSTLQRRESFSQATRNLEASSPAGSSVENVSGSHDTATSSTLQRRQAVANATGDSEGSSPAGSSVENVSGSHDTASSSTVQRREARHKGSPARKGWESVIKRMLSPGRGDTKSQRRASLESATEGHQDSSVAAIAKTGSWFSPRLRASAVIMFLLLPMLTGALWLAYNHNVYGNALEFANGPYSPRAIQARSWTPTWTSYPGENSARTATLYFLKVSRLNLGEGRSEYLLFAVAFVALLAALFFARRYLPWTLLWLPAIFYPACIAWGSVPVYVPQWWPFGYYNVRYGLQLLPAVAVFVGLLVEFTAKFFPRLRCPAAALLLLLAGRSYSSVWRHTPISLREAQRNGAARMDFDQRLGAELAKLPPESTIMMDCSSYSGALQAAGIPFRRVLRESNPPYWEIALSQPAQSADYVV